MGFQPGDEIVQDFCELWLKGLGDDRGLAHAGGFSVTGADPL